MAKSEQTIRWRALAPFGRVGHALGFRWVFFWTLPLPFHPVLFHAVPIGFFAWLFWLAAGGGPVAWTTPLWAALILFLPLSVPFLQWMLLAFRIQLLQAAMLPASMLLLGVAVMKGEQPASMAALPALYFALHLIAAAASRRLLARMAEENQAVERDREEHGALPPIVLEGDLAKLARLGQAGAGAALYTEEGTDRRIHIRIDTSDRQLTERLSALERMPHTRLICRGKPEVRTAEIGISYIPHGAARLRSAPGSAVRSLLVGRVRQIEMQDSEGRVRHCHDGRAAPISWFPGFMFLYYLRLGGNPGYGFEVGPVRGKQHILGALSGDGPPVAALIDTLRNPAATEPAFPDRTFIQAALDEAEDEQLGIDFESLDELLDDPESWHEAKLTSLFAKPERYGARAEDLVAGFATARAARRVMAGITLGRLIAALPPADYGRIGDVLIAELELPLMADELPLSARGSLKDFEHRPFSGFALLTQAPALYERLGELGPRALPLIVGLAEAHGWRRPLANAYRKATGKSPQA